MSLCQLKYLEILIVLGYVGCIAEGIISTDKFVINIRDINIYDILTNYYLMHFVNIYMNTYSFYHLMNHIKNNKSLSYLKILSWFIIQFIFIFIGFRSVYYEIITTDKELIILDWKTLNFIRMNGWLTVVQYSRFYIILIMIFTYINIKRMNYL